MGKLDAAIAAMNEGSELGAEVEVGRFGWAHLQTSLFNAVGYDRIYDNAGCPAHKINTCACVHKSDCGNDCCELDTSNSFGGNYCATTYMQPAP